MDTIFARIDDSVTALWLETAMLCAAMAFMFALGLSIF